MFQFYLLRHKKDFEGLNLKRIFQKKKLYERGDYGRERGIRTPGGVTLNGFQDRRFRPLSHLPKSKLEKSSVGGDTRI